MARRFHGWIIPLLAFVLWELWSHAGTFPKMLGLKPVKAAARAAA